MVRLVFCFSRRSEISVGEFRSYWHSDEHKQVIQTLIGIFSPDRYADTLAMHGTDIHDTYHISRDGLRGFDAMLELYWNDESILKERLLDQAVAKISKILRGQSERRIDGNRSTIFITEEPVIVDCALPRMSITELQ